MTQAIDPFEPIKGDEPFEQRIDAFNKLGLSLNTLHECMDEGFAEAMRARGLLGEVIECHIAKVQADRDATAAYRGAMQKTVKSNRDKFITLGGQLQAISDQSAMQSSAVETRLERAAVRVEDNSRRMDGFGESLLRIGERVGVGRAGELKPLSVWKIATTVGAALGLWTVALKLLPLLPEIDKALLQH